MIIDLCKPLHEGETRTVRIIMTVDEAREALMAPHDLLRGIQNAIVRHDKGEIVDG
jgi:hypothetical protein